MKPFFLALLLLATLVPMQATHASTILYGVDLATDQLVTINTTTGAATAIGSLGTAPPLGVGGVGSLAYDSINDILFGYDFNSHSLVTINTATGAATTAFSGELGWTLGMAYDSGSDTLFGLETPDGIQMTLVDIDRTTGGTTIIGPSPLANEKIYGLEYYPDRDVLVGIDTFSDRFLYINPDNGAIKDVAALSADVRGLAYDPVSGILYGANGDNNHLITIDPETGAVVGIGSTGFWAIRGLAFAPEASVVPVPPALPLMFSGLAVLGILTRRRIKL